jgi:hypothetical protein
MCQAQKPNGGRFNFSLEPNKTGHELFCKAHRGSDLTTSYAAFLTRDPHQAIEQAKAKLQQLGWTILRERNSLIEQYFTAATEFKKGDRVRFIGSWGGDPEDEPQNWNNTLGTVETLNLFEGTDEVYVLWDKKSDELMDDWWDVSDLELVNESPAAQYYKLSASFTTTVFITSKEDLFALEDKTPLDINPVMDYYKLSH